MQNTTMPVSHRGKSDSFDATRRMLGQFLGMIGMQHRHNLPVLRDKRFYWCQKYLTRNP
ncbi:MAG: hypothetical protein KME19_17955 [Microcoleus vaginatus WJT46-NPBG5]|nr:hypothetical protein [Microcoleus vaginatus WJT46-NPBG5]